MIEFGIGGFQDITDFVLDLSLFSSQTQLHQPSWGRESRQQELSLVPDTISTLEIGEIYDLVIKVPGCSGSKVFLIRMLIPANSNG